MAVSSLNRAETRLLNLAPLNEPIEFKNPRRLGAGFLREVALRLPGSYTPLAGHIGLRLKGATIVGRLLLDDARSADGTALPALEFIECVFEGGFSGANGQFSRLAFTGCSFKGCPRDSAGKPIPTIDLTGALVDSDLDLSATKPAGRHDLLWIAAGCAKITGSVDLAGAALRAPDEWEKRLFSDRGVSALGLNGAEVRGDLGCFRAHCEGSIAARGAEIRGDVWMSGATIRQTKGKAIFFQATKIGGLLMFDSRPDLADRSGRSRPFTCIGDLNLTGTQVGQDLVMDGSVVRGDAMLFDLAVRNDLFLGAHVDGTITLGGCRIGGSLFLSNLTLGASSKGLSLEYGQIGRSLQLIGSAKAPQLSHELLRARAKPLQCLPGVTLIETLWDHEDSPGQRTLTQISFLKHAGNIYPLDGTSASMDIVRGLVGHAIGDGSAAIEYLRVRCAYAHDRESGRLVIDGSDPASIPFEIASADDHEGPSGEIQAQVPVAEQTGTGYLISVLLLSGDSLSRARFEMTISGKSVEIEALEENPVGAAIVGAPRFDGLFLRAAGAEEAPPTTQSQWLAPPAIADMVDYGSAEMEAERGMLTRQLFSNISLRGEIDLENLSCDLLDDRAGCFWGTDVRIAMNHFVYYRTTWERDRNEEERRAHRRLWSAFLRQARPIAAWMLPVRLTNWFGWTDRLRRETPPTAWQTKLNWIYLQFDTTGLPSPTRYRIKPGEYHPQPFEQAIKVARAEGREDYATHFEIAKRNIEWRLFSLRHRGRFLALGLLAALTWLVLPRDEFTTYTLATAGVLLLFFLFVSDIFHFAMNGMFGHLRRPIRAIATLVGAFLIGWAGVDAANDRGMLVVDLAPVAPMVGPNNEPARIGSQRALRGSDLASDVHCGNKINEALYALDVLIPLIDLREENRCEVGEAEPAQGTAFRSGGLLGLFESWPRRPTDFWAVLKALYAVAGWFIVSLSILTFAQTTRSRADQA